MFCGPYEDDVVKNLQSQGSVDVWDKYFQLKPRKSGRTHHGDTNL